MKVERFFKFSENVFNNKALICSDKIFTFQMIEKEVEYISGKLTNYNITNRSRIGLLIGNNPLFVCCILAVIKLGASSVLISPNLKKYEIEDYLKDTNIQHLITDVKSDNIIKNLSFDKNLIYSEINPVFGNINLWNIFHPKINIGDIEYPDKQEDKEFILQFTSGVSGRSRIVPRSYKNVMDEIRNVSDTLSLTGEDTVICPVPLFHAYGLACGLLISIYKKAKLILMENFVPKDFINFVKKFKPTIFVGVPFMYSLLTRTFLNEDVNFSCFRLCLSAGDKLSGEVAESFNKRFGVNINQLYGSTETGVVAVNLYKDGFADVESVGKPVKESMVKIVDDNDHEVPLGEDGNIKIKSPGTTNGYLNMEGINSSIFSNKWFFSTDIGKIDNNGNLYITGRKSSFINTAGLKVDPFEIEQVLLLNMYVKECIVVGITDKNCGEFIRAYIVPEQEIPRKEIIDLCRERLADYKVPREIEFVKELPKSSTGKILKKYLV